MADTSRTGWIAAALAVALAAPPALGATSLKECSLKYQAAKTAGTLNGADWKTFRATQCDATAPAGVTKVAATTTPVPATTQTPAPAAVATAKTPAPVAAGHAPAATGNATFPTAIDPKYAKLTAGQGRKKTCLDQYHANKASGANGGLGWIAKNGYYSQCNNKLKGA